MMIRKLTLPALALTAALGLAACSPTPTAGPAPSSTADGRGEHEHTLVPSPSTTPDRAAVAARAVDALTAYGQRDLPYEEWFAQLQPFLDETAVDAYATVNPSRIPAFTIDGPGETADVTTTHAVVDVATSIGRYTLELRRADAAAEWSVTRIQPPS
jgi:hypothetical protein